jgi:hypothetical protein
VLPGQLRMGGMNGWGDRKMMASSQNKKRKPRLIKTARYEAGNVVLAAFAENEKVIRCTPRSFKRVCF